MADAAQPTRATPAFDGPPHPALRSRGARILLVTSDQPTAQFIRDQLGPAGYRLDEALGPTDAARRLEQQPPDAILIDEATGAEVVAAFVRRLRGDTSTRDIPLMLLASSDDGAAAALGIDVDDCLAKPLRYAELLLRVRGAVRLRRLRIEQPERRELRGEQARMWNVLLDFSRSVARTLVLDEVLDQIVATAAELTCSRRVSLMLPDDEQEHLVIAKALGVPEDVRASVRVPIGDAVAGRAFASGRRQTTLTRNQRNERPEEYSGESFVSMPIIASSMNVLQQRVGVLNITHRYDDRAFEEWELEFIDMLGSIAGSAIDDTIWRQARESLLKVERDLQVARRIQQNTFPKRLPQPGGFEIDAWSEPAEETGGDSYDVIGYRFDREAKAVRLSARRAERAMMLLADATGHGIGPALSVTQVRAMLRMAVRMKPDLGRIARHMNDQLCADLPRGRFITAWLGELDPEAGAIRCLSAGQGPILRFVAASGAIERIDSDTMPFGVMTELEIPAPRVVSMAPGDILGVISDGIFEAEDESGTRFSVARAGEIITRHAGESPSRILVALREAVQVYTNGAAPTDDRTAIIIRRAA